MLQIRFPKNYIKTTSAFSVDGSFLSWLSSFTPQIKHNLSLSLSVFLDNTWWDSSVLPDSTLTHGGPGPQGWCVVESHLGCQGLNLSLPSARQCGYLRLSMLSFYFHLYIMMPFTEILISWNCLVHIYFFLSFQRDQRPYFWGLLYSHDQPSTEKKADI